MGRIWTPEQKAKQAEKIGNWQPWKASTGATTTEGKAVVSRNGYKGGVRPKQRKIKSCLRDVRAIRKVRDVAGLTRACDELAAKLTGLLEDYRI